MTNQYEYLKYSRAHDSATHEVLCGVIAAGLATDCTRPYTKANTVAGSRNGSHDCCQRCSFMTLSRRPHLQYNVELAPEQAHHGTALRGAGVSPRLPIQSQLI